METLVNPTSQPPNRPTAQVSDRELYDKLMAAAPPGSGHAAFMAERAELLLGQAARMGLHTKWVLLRINHLPVFG